MVNLVTVATEKEHNMSQTISITLVHDEQLFEFTAMVENTDQLVWVDDDDDDDVVTGLQLKPLTSIQNIGEHCPDNVVQPAIQISEIEALHMQIWIKNDAETYSSPKAAIKAFNEYFNIEAE